MTRNRTKVWDLNYVTVIMSATTKSPMVHSSMVPVAGGKGGSIRHDDDGRPAPSGGSPASAGRGVFHFDDYRIESIQVGIIEVVETDDDDDDD
jgi:hypothetical protein